LSAATAPLDRIAHAFAEHGRRAALMPYLVGGFPDLDGSRAAVEACAAAGADVLELGIPFSDPLADGPGIHTAASRALAGGVTPEQVLALCAEASGRVPVILFVYANLALGGLGEPFADGTGGPASSFVERARAAGAAGLIVPDLPHEEAGPLREACDAVGLALVPLAAPNTPAERLAAIGASARGFIYTVSLAGTTGERAALPPDLGDTVHRVRGATDLPVAVGFGISTPEQARAVAGLADGVIVGSRIVRAADEGGPEAVGRLVEDLGRALA
jgi:tryptophan synthase alpha chain